MGQTTNDYNKASGSEIDTASINSYLNLRKDNLKIPEGFKNKEEYKARWEETARENLSDHYLLTAVQNKEPFGTGAAMAHLKNLPDDYKALKFKTGEMENIVNPTGNTGTTRMNGATKGQLKNLEMTSTELAIAQRGELSMTDKTAQVVVDAANKQGLSAQNVIVFHELSSGQKLSDGLAKPLTEAQNRNDAKAIVPEVAVTTPAPVVKQPEPVAAPS